MGNAQWNLNPIAGTRASPTGSADPSCQAIVATAPQTRLVLIGFFAERSLHTGEVVGSTPTAPTKKSPQAQQLNRRPLPFPPVLGREQAVKPPVQLGENPGNLFDKRSRGSLQRRPAKNRGSNKDGPQRGPGNFPSGLALKNRPRKTEGKAKRGGEQRQDACPQKALDDVAVAQVIRAELIGNNTAVAVGIRVQGYAPILKLCRGLLARGMDPATPLEAWRGSTLCLKVRSIGAAAALEIRPSGTGTPVFVRRKK
jgi:hypothetical protein